MRLRGIIRLLLVCSTLPLGSGVRVINIADLANGYDRLQMIEAVVLLKLDEIKEEIVSGNKISIVNILERREGQNETRDSLDLLHRKIEQLERKLSLVGPFAEDVTQAVIILRRMDGSVDFDRNWADYKLGFGDTGGEMWLGLDMLHELTTNNSYSLQVTITAWDGKSFAAYYSKISVGPESDNYRLSVSGYDHKSTIPDKLSNHNGMEFSTKDRDNDKWAGGSCPVEHTGGWWYWGCFDVHPTGLYLTGGADNVNGIGWEYVPGYPLRYSFKSMIFTLVRL